MTRVWGHQAKRGERLLVPRPELRPGDPDRCAGARGGGSRLSPRPRRRSAARTAGRAARPTRWLPPATPRRHLERCRDVVGRDEPERPGRAGVPAAGDEHTAGAVEDRCARRPVDVRQQRMRRRAPAVRGECARVGRRQISRGGELLGRRSLAQHVEEVAVRRLWAVSERPPEIVQEDDRPSLAERRGVAPEPKRMTEAGRRRGDRVQRLARLVKRLPRQRHDDRVERPGERARRAARSRGATPPRARPPVARRGPRRR